jgi:hypothetical protein
VRSELPDVLEASKARYMHQLSSVVGESVQLLLGD